MRTLILLGHPNKSSFTAALADAYEKGAREKGGDVFRVNLIDLRFDPILRYGYNQVQELEPDLQEIQRLIKWANHLVFIFPIWWSAPPALMKGFIDRVFLPGFAFKYHPDSSLWDRLLTNKSARLMMTSDAPAFWLYLMYFHPALNMMKKAVLEFSGVSPVQVLSFGSIKKADYKKRQIYLDQSYREGLQDN